MRRLLYWTAFLCLPCLAEETTPYQEWLTFKEEFADYAAGQTGMYAIQDNPKLPAQRNFKGLAYFPYDAQGVVVGAFHRNDNPTAVSYLDSRDHAGIMYVMGTLAVQIDGRKYDGHRAQLRREASAAVNPGHHRRDARPQSTSAVRALQRRPFPSCVCRPGSWHSGPMGLQVAKTRPASRSRSRQNDAAPGNLRAFVRAPPTSRRRLKDCGELS